MTKKSEIKRIMKEKLKDVNIRLEAGRWSMKAYAELEGQKALLEELLRLF